MLRNMIAVWERSMYASPDQSRADLNETIRTSQGIVLGLVLSAPLWALFVRILL